jgi:hypothetical protein
MTSAKQDFSSYISTCATSSFPLRAVGNEAVECSIVNGSDVQAEVIVARVRDRAFILRWTLPNPGGSIKSPSQEEIREKIRNIAEQVAGSLF